MPDMNNIADASGAPRDAQDEGHVSHEQSASAQFEIGSYVTFGRYPQNNGDTPEPIEWLVLDNDETSALLVSRYCLDLRKFHHENGDVSWNCCDLRRWLNGEFLQRAFSAAEIISIHEGEIYTEIFDKKELAFTKTCDKVFCLSAVEAVTYFHNDEERMCDATDYALGQALDLNVFGEEKSGNCWYWLRSHGRAAEGALIIDFDEDIWDSRCLDFVNGAVRPALRIKLQ